MTKDDAGRNERQSQAVAVLLSRVPVPNDRPASDTRWIEDRQEPDPCRLY